MKATIKTKMFGTFTIDTETFNASLCSPSHPIFKSVEYLFNKWFDEYTVEGAPLANDIIGCYEGWEDQPATYSKKGAIRQGIEAIVEYIEENNLTYLTSRDIWTDVDLEGCFQI